MKALPAKRYVNVNGFDDADYVEFKQGAEKGRGYKDSLPCGPLHYTREYAEGFVRHGYWREVPIPAGVPDVREVLISAGVPESHDSLSRAELLDLLVSWAKAAPGSDAAEICDRVMRHIERRMAKQRMAEQERIIEALQRTIEDIENMKGPK